MADARAFDLVCDHLERETALERPAARGTVRLALKEAGFDPENVTPAQMAVVAERVLPAELAALRIENVDSLCADVRSHLDNLPPDEGASSASPEAVFHRIGNA